MAKNIQNIDFSLPFSYQPNRHELINQIISTANEPASNKRTETYKFPTFSQNQITSKAKKRIDIKTHQIKKENFEK